jgi:hypothetical protein
MATVYLATDLRHGRKVAIKTLRAELAEGIARALQKAPDARWQTAAAMRESLAGAQV